jgi:glycosyltransferase involved in cell wall biosynthesis
MSIKKILIDARSIGGEGQGVVTYLRGLYNAFYHEYGSQYQLYFAGYHEAAILKTFPFLKKENFILLKSRSRLKLFAFEFPKIIKKNGIHFAHFQYIVPFTNACSYIVTSHDVLFLDFKEEFSWRYRMQRKWTFAQALRQSEICLTVSDYSKNKMVEHFGISPNTIAVTPNAVEPKFFEPYSKSVVQQFLKNKYKVEDYILYVSRIESRKNHQLLLQAFDELNLAEAGKNWY